MQDIHLLIWPIHIEWELVHTNYLIIRKKRSKNSRFLVVNSQALTYPFGCKITGLRILFEIGFFRNLDSVCSEKNGSSIQPVAGG
jgi:hypothetical protein